ncbi:MAG: hypothetical protein ACPGGK_11385 [Pikeienuella sp.]
MRILFALVLLLTPLFATAQPADHDDPRLQTAIQAWLADDDQTALPALAKLAAEGNTSAQILLGRLTNRPMSRWLADMNRKDRNKLLRAPGGLSGKSWLKVAAEGGSNLASAFVESDNPRAGEADIIALAEAGELSAANYLLERVRGMTGDFLGWGVVVTNAENQGAIYFPAHAVMNKEILTTKGTYRLKSAINQLDPDFTPSALYSVHKHYDLKDEPKLLTADELQKLLSRDRLMKQQPRMSITLIGTDGKNAPATPLSNRATYSLIKLCTSECSGEIRACVETGVKIAGGERALARLSSPIETLIPVDAYANSPRAIADLRRWVRTSTTYHPTRFRPTLSCFDAAFPVAD